MLISKGRNVFNGFLDADVFHPTVLSVCHRYARRSPSPHPLPLGEGASLAAPAPFIVLCGCGLLVRAVPQFCKSALIALRRRPVACDKAVTSPRTPQPATPSPERRVLRGPRWDRPTTLIFPLTLAHTEPRGTRRSSHSSGIQRHGFLSCVSWALTAFPPLTRPPVSTARATAIRPPKIRARRPPKIPARANPPPRAGLCQTA